MNHPFDKNTLKLLRIPFSFFLMPVYFMALSQSDTSKLGVVLNALLVFVVLHVFIYPASNGYNSYMDRDEGSIGGLKNPPKVTISLFFASLIFDFIGLSISYWISIEFFSGILLYVFVSRAYSWKGIRLKKMPIVGFLSVIMFQGFVTFINVYVGINHVLPAVITETVLVYPAIASSFMIAGVYPLTQIYQHEADKKNGDITISYLLGYRGTFIFSTFMFLTAGIILYNYFSLRNFMLFQAFLSPVAYYFVRWMIRVWNDPLEANFDSTMRMNFIAAFCMNFYFLFLLYLGR